MMENSNNSITLSTKELAAMINSDWDDLKKKNDFEFPNEEIETQCKTMFILGYHYAWEDMSQLSKGLTDLDELLKI